MIILFMKILYIFAKSCYPVPRHFIMCVEQFRLLCFSVICCLLFNLILLTDEVWLKVRHVYLLGTPAVVSFHSRMEQ